MSKPILPCRCGNCAFFTNQSTDGYGVCSIQNKTSLCSDICWLLDGITKQETVNILHYYQKWRRGGKNRQPHPYVVGLAIDNAIRLLRGKPEAITL